jgi:aspartate kinase
MMNVFKFGGASVKDASGIRNLFAIVSGERNNLVVVVSAFGKTTNALEEIHNAWRTGDASFKEKYDAAAGYHLSVSDELFGQGSDLSRSLSGTFASFYQNLMKTAPADFDHDYDMIVSMGEIWSTVIVEAYLRMRGLKTRWCDIRKLLKTDNRHREAGINWEVSRAAVTEAFTFNDADIYVTQGFIGATASGEVTTLGREGSDYTAAVIANMLDAKEVVVWKDVPGIMNADPDWMPAAVTLEHLSYNEAVEMSFSGAKVIHPKTIKPLHNKKIPMHVRSFIDPYAGGTVISEDAPDGSMSTVFVRKEGQILISVLPKDLSFVMGDNLASLFHILASHGVRVSLVQAGAVSINICADHEEPKISRVLEELGKDYTILYNDGAEMLTIRHSSPGAAERVTGGKEVLLSQTTRNTVRMVVRDK